MVKFLGEEGGWIKRIEQFVQNMDFQMQVMNGQVFHMKWGRGGHGPLLYP